MNEEGMRHVLKSRGLSLLCDRRQGGTVYTAAADGGDGKRYQRRLGSETKLLPMNPDDFAVLVAEKTGDYIGTSRKCAMVPCMRRRSKANRVVLTTTFGEVAVWLCDQCFKGFQNSL